MSLKLQIIAGVIGIFFLIFIGKLLKKNQLHPSFAALWLGITMFLISIPIIEPFYKWLAISVIGVYTGNDLIYIALIGFLLIYVLYLSSKICQMSDRIQKLISYTAILEHDMKKKDS